MRNAFGNLATDTTVDEGLTLLRRMLALLKPLGVVTGAQSNRLSVDVQNVALVGSITSINTVSVVSTVGNQNNMGGVSAFDLMKAMSRTGYNTGPRANIT
jgi:hypothetical protein